MTLDKIADQIFETDLLVVGGGLAGCMAALKARDRGVQVLIMEKAAIRRSGDAGCGMDHFPGIVHPKFNARVDGATPSWLSETEKLTMSGFQKVADEYAIKALREVEKIGVKVSEEDGEYKVQPMKILNLVYRDSGTSAEEHRQELEREIKKVGFILYRGADLKLKLAAEVHRRGIQVLDRMMLCNLLTSDGNVVGATGVNVRTGKFVVVRAKVTILATGAATRLYWHSEGTFPNNLFMLYHDPANCGDGIIAAYHAGARLANMEFVDGHTNAVGLPRGFTLTWFKLQNTKGEDVLKKHWGNGKSAPLHPVFLRTMAAIKEREQGELVGWDPTQLPDDAEMWWQFMAANERPYSLKLLRAIGGLKNAPRESRFWYHGVLRDLGGVLIDLNGQTALKGLYAAGDIVGGGKAGATTAVAWGYREGEMAAEYAQAIAHLPIDEDQVKNDRERALAPLARADGIHPLEMENIVRKIITEYVGLVKSEAKLKRGLEQLEFIQNDYVPQLRARNPHELMRALEAQSVLQVGLMHARTSLLREESRFIPSHYREDFSERDDARWNKSIVLWQREGQMEYALQEL
ncbi:fumarate reductase (CoM/CoB) subunit A [Anaerolineae bacterium]|nr:fumarate reductase (CoM/CoB) subunit A [Anaerolineae bacterium]